MAGEVRAFDPAATIEERFLVQTDRFTHYAMAAADFALDDARLGPASVPDAPYSIGVVTAAGSGGGEFGQRELRQLVGQGQPVRRAVPVHRLVLRREHRPGVHPPRLQGTLLGRRL